MHRVTRYYSQYGLILLTLFAFQNSFAQATDSVRLVQQRLRDLGFYSGQVSGEADESTSVAIRDYQSSAGLPVTGEATGSLTWALSRPCKITFNEQAKSLLYQGGCPKNPDGVSIIKYKLVELGYLINIDGGVSEAQLDQAIREYERTVDLPITGKPTGELFRNLLLPCMMRVESSGAGSSARPRGGCRKPTKSPYGEIIDLK